MDPFPTARVLAFWGLGTAGLFDQCIVNTSIRPPPRSTSDIIWQYKIHLTSPQLDRYMPMNWAIAAKE